MYLASFIEQWFRCGHYLRPFPVLVYFFRFRIMLGDIGGKKCAVQCGTFLISVTTCSNFQNMGIKRQVLRKFRPFIDKTKLYKQWEFF